MLALRRTAGRGLPAALLRCQGSEAAVTWAAATARQAGATTRAPAAAAALPPAQPKEFLVYRWTPEDDVAPRYQSYSIDMSR